jgi:gliding motility-associated-like protein
MKNILLLFSIFIFNKSNAQCTTNNLPFQTNASDWLLFSNNVGLTNNTPPFVIPHLTVFTVYWWDSTAAGDWISGQNAGIHPTDGIGLNQAVRYRYTFKACGTDSLNIKMNFFRDNFCLIFVDNNLVFADPQGTPTNQNNLNVGTTINVPIANVGITTTTHTIDFEIVEFNVAYNYNGWGGKMNGTITSKTGQNSIVFNTAACNNYSCCLATPLTVSSNTNICLGDATTLTASSSGNITWTNTTTNISTTGNSLTASPIVNTTYLVVASDGSGCNQSQTITIKVDTKPNITISKSNDIACKSPSCVLNVSGAQNYSWSPNGNLDNPNISNPVASPIVNTTYTVLASNGACSVSSTVLVLVDSNFINSVSLPTAFTPNDDGLNDCWRIVSYTNFNTFDLKIFNRWGEIIYQTSDPNFCWYGSQKGNDIDITTTFFYMLHAETSCNLINKKGDVTVVR